MEEERIIKMPVEVYECPTKVTEAHTDELLDIMLASGSTIKFKNYDDGQNKIRGFVGYNPPIDFFEH
tara:strand:+ start:801 stop:1001 length:201 start_codon:yes stop_codon:yes gene_type:complete